MVTSAPGSRNSWIDDAMRANGHHEKPSILHDGFANVSARTPARQSLVLLLTLVCLLGLPPAGAIAEPPPNDDFADVEALSLTLTGTNIEATKELNEPNHAGNIGGHSVWYSVTAPFNGSMTLDTCGSDFDTLLGVYTGSSVSTLVEVAGNDDSCGTRSKVELLIVAGKTYYAAVDGYEGATGSIQGNLTLEATPPPPLPPPGGELFGPPLPPPPLPIEENPKPKKKKRRHKPGVTRREYIARAEPSCVRYIRSAKEPLRQFKDAIREGKFGKAARMYHLNYRYLNRMLADLTPLELPRASASLIKRWLHGLRSQRPLFRRFITALKQSGVGPLTRAELKHLIKTGRRLDSASEHTKALVRHYGFKHCDEV